MIFWSIRAVSKSPTRTTSSPGPPPRSKWRSKKPLAKAAEILQESWSILSRDTWWNGFFGGCFQRLVALFVFLQSETVVQTKRRHFMVFSWQNCNEFWSHFGSLGQGFLRPPFWTRLLLEHNLVLVFRWSSLYYSLYDAILDLRNKCALVFFPLLKQDRVVFSTFCWNQSIYKYFKGQR